MTNHLSEDQFARCMVGQPTSPELQHIAQCEECSAELERFGSTLTLFRNALRDRVDERASYASGMTSFPARSAKTEVVQWRWAMVAAAMLILMMLPFLSDSNELVEEPAQEARGPVFVRTSPEELMDAVNMHLSRTLPSPMEPMMSILPADGSVAESGGVQ